MDDLSDDRCDEALDDLSEDRCEDRCDERCDDADGFELDRDDAPERGGGADCLFEELEREAEFGTTALGSGCRYLELRDVSDREVAGLEVVGLEEPGE